MIRTFEAFLAAVIIFGTLLYFSPNIHLHSSSLSINEKSYDEYYGCGLFSKGERMDLIIVEFNESFKDRCVVINVPYNTTYAFYDGKEIPSGGGNNITIEIESYEKGEPVFIYVRNGTLKNINCHFPKIEVGYNYILKPSNKYEYCGDVII